MTHIPPHRIYEKLALEREAEFDWIEAEKYHRSAVEDLLEKGARLDAGEIQERAAYSLYRASYQAETVEAFKGLLRSASLGYGRAAEIFEGVDVPKREGRVLSSRGMEHFHGSWLIVDPPERKAQMARCVEILKDALRASEGDDDGSRYGKVCNDYLFALFSYSELSFTQTEGLEILDEALEVGTRALKALNRIGDERELARCFYLLSMFLVDRPMAVIESVERQQELLERGMGYAEKAVELSMKAGDPYLIGVSHGALSYFNFEVKGDIEAAKSLAGRHLEYGKKIRDRLVLARAYESLAYYTDTSAFSEEDREKIRAVATEALNDANEAMSNYRVVNHPVVTAPLPRNHAPYLLGTVETDRELKYRYELEGLETSLADLKYTQESGSQLGEMYLYHAVGSSYLSLAKLERDEKEKERMLHESMLCQRKFIESSLQAQPFYHWNMAAAYVTLADIIGQIAKSEEDRNRKAEYLADAIAEMEKSPEYFNEHFRRSDDAASRDNYALAQIKYGELLFQMYLASDDENYLDRSVQQFSDAIETYRKLNSPSYIAETLWKMAWAYYQAREYQRSATEFDGASRYYAQAGEKYSNHRDFYADYVGYMEAWGNIARAMDYHSRDEYFLEKEYFEKAADLMSSSERWRYLGPNYMAWARLAEAENKSRKDQTEEAIELFKASSTLFSSAKIAIEEKFGSIGVRDEADMATKLRTASDLRIEYCNGRVAVEEAKLLDRRGEQAASSRRYGDAAKTFLKIMEAMETEAERREIRPLHSLCLAWQKMAQAEAGASASLYIEASTLFDEARELCTNEKTRLLTTGHASFCRALGAGIQYEVSREEHLHRELTLHIGSATDFYVRAGYDFATDYSRATQRLFEAYQYMDRARGAENPDEKARNFAMAERLLGISAEAFSRAKHPNKRDEVTRLLRSLREDREIASSLSQILDTPGISSSTESFRVPTPSHEYPAGLEGFEHADIQGRMFTTSDVVTSGEEFHLELELYNPGKSSATLASVENLFPGDFEVTGVSGIYRYEDETLDLRGKRIGPMSTIEISMRTRPISKGEYTLKPRVVFLDDTGERRTSETEPITVTVQEMGIMRWLRGADRPD